MPTLQLQITPPVPQAVQAALAQELTALTAELLGKRREVTALMVHALPAPDWYIGGLAATVPTACLEISITAGTNTAAQKEAFIDAAYSALRQHLAAGGELADASYVIVRELPAGDWGYGGRTQRARQLARVPDLAQAK
jgi:4-oxalocrotonate tautomerase